MMEKKLPKGWASKKLGTVVTYKKGKKPAVLSEEEFENSVPYLDIRALERKEYRQYADKKTSNLVDSSCIAILWDGARSGWTSKVVFGAMGSTLAALTPKEDDIDFLFFFLKSQFQYLNSNMRGTGIPHVDPSVLWNLDVPLPPLAEQKRIVAKLDEAFKHIEILKSKLDCIPVLLKQFKQTVLTHAVTGKLTEDWRKGKALPEWKEYKLGKLGKWVGGGTPSKAVKAYWQEGKVLWVTSKDMKTLFISDSKDKITVDAVKNSSANFIPKNSILIVTRSGILRRILPVSLNTVEITVNQDLKALIPENSFLSHFILYYLIAKEKHIRNSCMKNGTTVESVEYSLLKEFPISIPHLSEQKEIVKRIEELTSVADKIESQYKILKAKTDKLPQALLAKAFKGELVAQNPIDGDAKSLLYAVDQLPELLQVAEGEVVYKMKEKE